MERTSKRALWKTVVVWLIVAVMMAFPITLAGVFLKSNASARSFEARMEILAHSGVPVTLEALNAWYEEPPEGANAAAHYQVAFDALALKEYVGIDDIPVAGNAEWPLLGEPLPQAIVKKCRAFLDARAGVLNALNEATRLDACRFSIDLTQGFKVDLPHLALLRSCLRVTQVDAVLMAAQGQPRLAAERTVASWRMAGALEAEPLLISQLVRAALMGLALQTFERVLSTAALDEAGLQTVAAALETWSRTDGYYRALIGERCNVIARYETAGQFPVIGAIDRDYFLAAFENLLALTQKSYPERFKALSHDEEKPSRIGGLLHPESAVLIPAITRAGLAFVRAEALRRCALAAVAVERYRLASGRLPESLEAVQAGGQDPLLGDVFDGDRPLRFKSLAKGYVVYSIGPDGQDDGAPATIWDDLAFRVRRD